MKIQYIEKIPNIIPGEIEDEILNYKLDQYGKYRLYLKSERYVNYQIDLQSYKSNKRINFYHYNKLTKKKKMLNIIGLYCINWIPSTVILNNLTSFTLSNSKKEYVPIFSNLTILNLYECLELKKIPTMNKLEELFCECCYNLEEIPNFKGLKILILIYCEILKEIPNIKGLKKLICVDCPLLEKIPNIKTIHTLELNYCYNCLIKEIPNIIGLKELVLGIPDIPIPNIRLSYIELSCLIITEIPGFLRINNCLKELIVFGCNKLLNIPNINGLEYLICESCKNLEEISEIEGLKKLNYYNCPLLMNIPKIENCLFIYGQTFIY